VGEASSKCLAGTTALLTGACGTIGSAVAQTLADEGVNVLAHYHRNVQGADSLCAALRASGVKAWAVQADLAEATGADALFAACVERSETIDLLINSASTFPENTLKDLTWTGLQSAVLANAWSPFSLCRAFCRLPETRRKARAIVNILDSRITGGDPAHAGYLLSKRLLGAMTDMMALAFAPGIRVNAVAPGLVAAGDIDMRAQALPLMRPVDPREVADAVVFLLKSPGITGEILYIDGGRRVREASACRRFR
jgi:NAD(P)-dependent dehydrogenase (short-subunit alcohol dehydrogenase family)